MKVLQELPGRVCPLIAEQWRQRRVVAPGRVFIASFGAGGVKRHAAPKPLGLPAEGCA